MMTWVIFNLFVLAMLVLDLKVFHRHPHEIKLKEALGWSAFWIGLALLFNLGIALWRGQQAGLEFLTGYLIEKSLSVDNIFVFLLILTYFKVPAMYQHEVLFWGILGALIMRAIFIAAGIALLKQFHWIIYLFGAFLVLTGIKLALEKDKEVHPERNPVLQLFRRLMPVTERYEGGKFFVRRDDRTWATPLFVVLLVVETTDLVFAVDSIPAILAITHDPFIVYTSNVFAILGLRALYFALAGIMRLFRHLHYGLAAILVFVGVKMLISDFYKIPIGVALGVVGGILALSILASLTFKPTETAAHPAHKGRRARPMGLRLGWGGLALVSTILGVAAVASIRGGPDARHAAAAIRLAQEDVAKARAAYRDMRAPKELQEAEAELSRSTAALEQRRYEESMAMASRARRLAQSSLK